VFTALAGAPGVPANLPVQVPRDFLPIGFVTQQPMFIAVSPKLGINSLSDLIAQAKKRPGEISYATTGIGRITHLTMELLQMRAGIKLQMVPYAGGPSQALSDLIAGRVAIVLDGYSGLAAGWQSGSLKGIAVATTERLPEFPDLPTVAETLPGFFAGGWNVLLAPIGTPEAIVRKVGADLRTALEDKEVKSKLAGLGAYVRPMSPQELTAFINEQQKIWKPVAEAVAKTHKK
jgi:tripartite-type tricarboxylate transporter receptor subunit TctC